jgi:transcriptional regulator with XRE-family HTH domain
MSTIADRTTLQIARAVKDRREQLGLSLRALASASGVSSSMISDVERGAKSPTIATLAALAEALKLPISTLLENPPTTAGPIRVVRAGERSEVIDPASGIRRYDMAASLAGSRIEFLRYAVPPHAEAGPFAAHARGTIEHMHLAAGSIRVVFGTSVVMLYAGDSCTCLADTPHRFDNRDGNVEALIYLVVEGP